MDNPAIPEWVIERLREPKTLAAIELRGGELVSSTGIHYPINGGIPVFANHENSYQNKKETWPEVNKDNPTVRALQAKKTIFDEFGKELEGKIVVDMCSGGAMPSYFLAATYGCKVISIERAYNALKEYGDAFKAYYCVPDSQVVRICADAAYLPLADGTVDAVVGSSWVHHFLDKKALLHNVHRVLVPGGRIVAHNEGVKGILAIGTSDEDLYVSSRAYQKAMSSVGFHEVEVKGCSRWYWALWWLYGSVDIVGKK